jgi:hypothetical protein
MSLVQWIGNADGFHLGEEIEAILPPFSAHTAMFHTAKCGVKISNKPTVNPNKTGANFICGVVGLVDVLGPD